MNPTKATVEEVIRPLFQQPVVMEAVVATVLAQEILRKILIRQSRGIKRSGNQTLRLCKELLGESL